MDRTFCDLSFVEICKDSTVFLKSKAVAMPRSYLKKYQMNTLNAI